MTRVSPTSTFKPILRSALALTIFHSISFAPNAVATEANAPSRAKVLEQLANGLVAQKKVLTSTATTISKANLKKLRPALQRQRKTMLSRKILVIDPNSEKVKASTATISGEIVGSINPLASTDEAADPLNHFHSRLASQSTKAKSRPLTILHISGSKLSSERLQREMRIGFQKLYGDAGHGMISPARNRYQSQSDSFKLTRTGRWRRLTDRRKGKAGFGISGMRLSSRSSMSSVTFTSQSDPFDWVGVTIATGPSQGTFTLKAGDVEKKFDAYAKSPGSQLFKLNVRAISATLTPGGGARTGVMNWHSGKSGVGMRYIDFQLDNASDKKASKYDPVLLTNDVGQLAPDLIIVDQASMTGATTEPEGPMVTLGDKLLDQIRASAPQASLLYLEAGSTWQSKAASSCTKPVPLKAANPKVRSTNTAAHWRWSPDLVEMCAIERQIKSVRTAGSAENQPPTLDVFRAKSLMKWLTKPASANRALARR
ncbi:MAG: hypothetical protein GKR97_00725 [Rhizobiaceae bacterium]|nr:hypothetical protein [Rhizobiaceae bacterium]